MWMNKDFDTWNKQKKQINSGRRNRPYSPKEIWWCSLGVNVGSEQDGSGRLYRRPVLIIKGLSPTSCLAAPLTTSPEKHFLRIPIGDITGKKSSVILSQMRVIDTKRFLGKIGFLGTDTFEFIRKAVKDML
jgi:mRNA-degrading endonuclease toxin of MazEF toxin-antitoxin module